jgi:aarF domain-containing kinase
MKLISLPTAAVCVVVMAVGLHRLGSLTNADGLLRSLYFWYGIFPVYLHYRGIQLLKRDLGVITSDLGEQWYSAAHERHALRLRDLHYALRGYYLKNAQLLSTQPDMVPAAWMAWMEKTQDSVPSEFESYAAARAYCAEVLEREQGLAFDEVFSEWQDAPLGVASIGQVHRARLRRTGEAVAVKLQFAGMERRFRSDLRTLKAFCHFAMPQHVTGFKEVENSFGTYEEKIVRCDV